MVAASGTQAWTREINIRRRISNIFNKREDDFPSLRDYNDYLEEVEDMTFDLIEGRNVAAIEAKIARYQDENAELIMNNRARKAEELAEALRACKANPMQADSNDMGSVQNSQGLGVAGQYAPAQPRPMGQPVPLGSGQIDPLQEYEDEDTKKFRASRAGGWSIEFSKKRAIEEAFGSICI
ncbi:hypothetical protein LUZ60_004720 [Juncus effusus]|nr:hypothetical protein LUZ60_004720 [Juncus effusus]